MKKRIEQVGSTLYIIGIVVIVGAFFGGIIIGHNAPEKIPLWAIWVLLTGLAMTIIGIVAQVIVHPPRPK